MIFPLTSEEMTDTVCSFTRNVTFVTCFLFAKVGQHSVRENYLVLSHIDSQDYT